MVVVVVGHMDAMVEGVKCPMSNFLYFLFLCEGITASVLAVFLFIFGHFLPKGRQGLHLPAPGAI